MVCASESLISDTAEDARALPWGQPRFDLCAYGYRWVVSPMPGAHFLQSAEALRDKGLDYEEVNREFFRPGLAYPMNADQRVRYLRDLDVRKSVPSGLSAGRYECAAMAKFGDIIVPSESKLVVHFHDWMVKNGTNYPFPYRVIDAKVDAVSRSTAPFDLAVYSPNGGVIAVFDFRFQAIRENRYCERISYNLPNGQLLRSVDDPESLSQQKHTLNSGPTISLNGLSPHHKYIWAAFLILGLGGLALARASTVKKERQST
jgi:hypothetical protein